MESSSSLEIEAGTCHELRTSLNVITGLAELLLGGGPGRLNSEQRLCIRDILASGRKILMIIDGAAATPREVR
jgi:signal transduction histidine kinase